MKERPEKGEWRDDGREGRCSGLMAGSEIKELRMSEQMEEQRPREVKLFPRVTLLLGELGRQLPVIVFLGQAFITTRRSRVTLLGDKGSLVWPITRTASCCPLLITLRGNGAPLICSFPHWQQLVGFMGRCLWGFPDNVPGLMQGIMAWSLVCHLCRLLMGKAIGVASLADSQAPRIKSLKTMPTL